ncbi:hypothetical protein Sjap_023051 [Stephania japonica]|uniref:Uncharacterized protein n=1 Tax=Stephania japonica TaxID=461633 RepID=A0AAP0EYU2_9MAGN
MGPVAESPGMRVCAPDEAVEGLEHSSPLFYYCRDILVPGQLVCPPLHAAALPHLPPARTALKDPSGWPEGRRPPTSRQGGGSGGGEVVETTPLPPSSSRLVVVGLPSEALPAVSGGGNWNAAHHIRLCRCGSTTFLGSFSLAKLQFFQ